MPRFIDLTGKVFGRLTVVGCAGRVHIQGSAWAPTWWVCRCACGNYIQADGADLKRGHTHSCGCITAKHGQASNGRESGAYVSYTCAKKRCLNLRNKDYYNYGARGIKFLFTSFEQFFAEVGHRPLGKTIDRIDVNGHYEPGNVTWSTPLEQSRNKRPRAKKRNKKAGIL